MKRSILLSGITIEYDLEKKKIKNVNIRVKSDLSVCVSAPIRISQKRIDEILTEKSEFILSAIKKYEDRLQETETCRMDGEGNQLIAVLGSPLPVKIIGGKKNRAEISGGAVLVTLKNISDDTACKKAISTALDELCRKTVTEICEAVHPQFERYVSDLPNVKFRHMRTRWGSCTPKKNLLTFNYALIHAPIECVEYVVYHEFTHFIHPNHSKAFYTELSRRVPDYKEKKKRLEAVAISN